MTSWERYGNGSDVLSEEEFVVGLLVVEEDELMLRVVLDNSLHGLESKVPNSLKFVMQ